MHNSQDDGNQVTESKFNVKSERKRPLVQTKLFDQHFKRSRQTKSIFVQTHDLLSDDEEDEDDEDDDDIEVVYDSKPQSTVRSSPNVNKNLANLNISSGSEVFNHQYVCQPEDDSMDDDSLDECDFNELTEICQKIQTNEAQEKSVKTKSIPMARRTVPAPNQPSASSIVKESLLTDDDEEQESECAKISTLPGKRIQPARSLTQKNKDSQPLLTNVFDGQLVFKRDKISVNKNEKSGQTKSKLAKVKQEPDVERKPQMELCLDQLMLSSDSDTNEGQSANIEKKDELLIRPLSIPLPQPHSKSIKNGFTGKAATSFVNNNSVAQQRKVEVNKKATSLLANAPTVRTKMAGNSKEAQQSNQSLDANKSNQVRTEIANGLEHTKKILGNKRTKNSVAKSKEQVASASGSVVQSIEKKSIASTKTSNKSVELVAKEMNEKLAKNSTIENDKKNLRNLESYVQKSNVCRYSQTEFDIFDLLRSKREKHELAESRFTQLPVSSTANISSGSSTENSCGSDDNLDDDQKHHHEQHQSHRSHHRRHPRHHQNHPTSKQTSVGHHHHHHRTERMPIDKERPLTLTENLNDHRLNLKHKKSETSVSSQIKESFESILLDILTWKASWLKEELIDLLPPQLCKEPLVKPQLIYNDFNEYMAVFKPLILLEIWANALERFSVLKCIPTKYVNLFPVAYCEDGQFVIFTCKLAMSCRDFNKSTHPNEGDLLLLELHLMATPNSSNDSSPSDSGQTQVKRKSSGKHSGRSNVLVVFGYVHDLTVHEINKEMANNTPYQYGPECDKMLRFSIKTRSLNLRLDNSKMVRARSFFYVRPQLRQCEAICSLQFSPLKHAILRPNFQYSQIQIPSDHQSINQSMVGNNDWNDYNDSQKKTIASSFELIKQPHNTNKILLIQGPPGTGKTHTIIGMIKKIYMDWDSDKYPKILICAPSNGAIDEIAIRLYQSRHFFIKSKANRGLRLVRIGQEDQIHPNTRKIYIDTLVESNLDQIRQERQQNHSLRLDEMDQQLSKLVAESVEMKRRQIDSEDDEMKKVEREIQRLTMKISDLRRHPSSSSSATTFATAAGNSDLDLDRMKKNLRRDILTKADIILSTLNSCRNQQLSQIYKESKTFNCCIVDEASQCCEPEILMPLTYLSITKFILIGDPMQLPATVISTKALEFGYGRSLFERHFNYFNTQKKQNNPLLMLDTQYRMHREICRFPSTFFYNNRLKTERSVDDRLFPLIPYAIFDLQGTTENVTNPKNIYNKKEGDFILRLFRVCCELINKSDLQRSGGPKFKIGIITPYQGQKRYLQSRIDNQGFDVEINTIDGFQGQERDLILISSVRAADEFTGSSTGSVGFLNSQQRLNVAITRAKHSLFICMSSEVMQRSSVWKHLITDAKTRQLCFPLPLNCNNEKISQIIAIPPPPTPTPTPPPSSSFPSSFNVRPPFTRQQNQQPNFGLPQQHHGLSSLNNHQQQQQQQHPHHYLRHPNSDPQFLNQYTQMMYPQFHQTQYASEQLSDYFFSDRR